MDKKTIERLDVILNGIKSLIELKDILSTESNKIDDEKCSKEPPEWAEFQDFIRWCVGEKFYDESEGVSYSQIQELWEKEHPSLKISQQAWDLPNIVDPRTAQSLRSFLCAKYYFVDKNK